MTNQTAGVAFADDFRLADFKLLLPLGDEVRALLVGTDQTAFARHLAGDLARLEQPSSGASAVADEYELVFSEDLGAVVAVRPGGWLCLLRPPSAKQVGAAQAAPVLQPIGSWRAYPDWPGFRVLIPETRPGWYAAARALRLFPWRSWLGMGTRLWPGLAKHWLPANGIALYQRPGPQVPTLLSRSLEALSEQGASSLRATPFERWLLVSGRLGPGNPILAFALDAQGEPRHLIKLARVRGATHLEHEAQQLAAITDALSPATSAKVIRPIASAVVDERWVLAYAYAPTQAFFGLRWQLQGRRGFCLAMADWLAALATETRRANDAVLDAGQRAPLRRLVARRLLPPALQQRAERALATLESEAAAQVPLVLEHGDLGIYNVRLSQADGSDFRVLDWGSSTFDGVPVGDLGYLLCSARAPKGLARRCLSLYLGQIGCPAELANPCWFAYLARRWEELDRIRPPRADDPNSGGGLLRPIAERMAVYLDSLGAKP